MEVIVMKTVTITGRGQIAIPKEIRKLKGFREGSKLAVIVFKDRVELRPADFFERHYTALMSEKTLAKDWLSKEDEEAWKDL